MEALNFHFWSSEREYENENLGEKLSIKFEPVEKVSASVLIPKEILSLWLKKLLLAFRNKPYLKKFKSVS